MVKCPRCGYEPSEVLEKLYLPSRQQLPDLLDVMQWHYWAGHPDKLFKEDYNVSKVRKEIQKPGR